MPRGDGTGPMGMGQMTGRGAGYCAGFTAPGYANLPNLREALDADSAVDADSEECSMRPDCRDGRVLGPRVCRSKRRDCR
jgi:hypothetical protein